MSRGLLSVVEAAYETAGDANTWLDTLVDRLQPSFDTGLGVVALLIDASATQGSGAAIQAVASRGLSDRSMEALGPLVGREAPPEARLRFSQAGPVSTVLSTFAGTDYGQEIVRAHAASRTADTLYVMAGDPRGVSCVLLAPQVEARRLSPSRKESLCYLAAHVATANRLRQRDKGDPIEAILRADGTMAEGTGPATDLSARAALRKAALAVTRAKESGPNEHHRALRDWEALVRGRWSLVDHFHEGGHRYLVARCSEARARPLGDLTEHEAQVARLAALGHPNKLIAYELGTTPTTVSSRLTRAMRKMGIASRVDLIRCLAEDDEKAAGR